MEKTSYARNTFDELVRDYPVKVTGTDMDFRFDFQGDTSITITKEEYRAPLKTRLIKEKSDMCGSCKETFRKRAVAL